MREVYIYIFECMYTKREIERERERERLSRYVQVRVCWQGKKGQCSVSTKLSILARHQCKSRGDRR